MDIFPNVQPDVYKEKVVDIFKQTTTDLAGDVLFKIINDDEATAMVAYQKVVTGLAAYQKANHDNVLCIFLGELLRCLVHKR